MGAQEGDAHAATGISSTIDESRPPVDLWTASGGRAAAQLEAAATDAGEPTVH